MVELAILLPVIVVLFLGAWTAADLVADNNTAIQATQEGARYAAELGDGSTLGTGVTVSQVDRAIIEQMLPVLHSQFTNAVINEIDIYQPEGSGNDCTFNTPTCPPDNGAYLSTDLADQWPISGTTIGTPSQLTYTLAQRDQIHPYESELGVRVIFTYSSPTMSVFTQTDKQYAVVRLAPVE
jgi:hypothetical protein